ncbi:MAG: Gfo/Idh/MocA family oxidoreductase [Patescibacteria group bacterium]
MDTRTNTNEVVNLLLIGFGPHAKRIYFPIYVKNGKENYFKIVHAVDLVNKKEDLENYFKINNYSPIDILFLGKGEYGYSELTPKVKDKLNKIVKQKNIKGVIISTEPLAHLCYAKWALENGLSILMDKPISTAKDVTTSLSAVEQIKNDFELLKNYYQKAKKKYPNIVFNLMAQRRYHPAFQKIRELIKEVGDKTNCPITSIQSFHSDGQWRMPNEIIDLDYHSYNQGYGKCSHSGYHSIDIAPWLIQSYIPEEKKLNNIDIFSNFSKPTDFLKQINLDDYKKIFSNFDKYNKYDKKTLLEKYKKYGEIDCFLSLAYKIDDKVITLSTVNLLHNGFSQRGWLNPENRDLYKGNGRLRHESHYIAQGPFQSISFISYQSEEVNPNNFKDIYKVGGEYHLDIHVFRNSNLFPNWKSYEKISIKDLTNKDLLGKSRGHQEDARKKCVIEFVKMIKGFSNIKPLSDYLDHELSTMLFYAAYKSFVLRTQGKNPIINVKIN